MLTNHADTDGRPGSSEQDENSFTTADGIRLTLRLLGSAKWLYALLLICLAITSVCGALPSRYYTRIYDEALVHRDMDLLVSSGTIVIGLYLASTLILIVAQYLLAYTSQLAHNRMRGHILERCLASDLEAFEKMQTGQLIDRIQQDAGAVIAYIGMLFQSLFIPAFRLASTGYMLYVLEWRFLLLVTAMSVIPAVVMQLAKRRIESSMMDMRTWEGAILHRLTDFLTGFMDMRAAATPSHFLRVLNGDQKALMNARLRFMLVTTSAGSLSSFAGMTTTAALVIFGGFLAMREITTIGAIFGAISLVGQFSASVQSLISLQLMNFQVRMNAKRLGEVLNVGQGERRYNDKANPAHEANDEVLSATDLSICRGGLPILHGNSLSIKRGGYYVLSGENGTGKSTLCYALAGLLDPCDGRIEIGGTPMEHLAPHGLRKQVALVRKNPHMFTGSLRFNVTCSADEYTEAEFLRAIRAARLDEVADRAPEGWETHIGSGGLELSAGEKSRVALARALLSAPKLLILDETLSSLPEALAEEILHDLRTVYPGMSALIVSHSRNAANVADYCWHLEEGTIHETTGRPPATRVRVSAV